MLLGDVAANAAAAAATELCAVDGEKGVVEVEEVDDEVDVFEVVEVIKEESVLEFESYFLVEFDFLLPSLILIGDKESSCVAPVVIPSVLELLLRAAEEDGDVEPSPVLLLLLPLFPLLSILDRIRLILSPCLIIGLFSSRRIFLCLSFSSLLISSKGLNLLPYLSFPGPCGFPGP